MAVNPSANHITVRSGVVSIRSGSAPGTVVTSQRTSASNDQETISEPHTAPMSAMIALSVSNCWIRRQRVAPTDKRMAISLVLAVARASSRLATLAAAISSTRPNAARTMAAPVRTERR